MGANEAVLTAHLSQIAKHFQHLLQIYFDSTLVQWHRSPVFCLVQAVNFFWHVAARWITLNPIP